MHMQTTRRKVENYLVIWADKKFDSNKSDFKNTLNKLRSVVNEVNQCMTVEECSKILDENKHVTTFLIVSGALGERLVPNIHAMPQIDTIYIFCTNKPWHDVWAKRWNKIKDVYTSIDPICEALELSVKQCNLDNTSLSIISANKNDDNSNQDFNHLEPSFMYTQIFKDILLEMEHEQTSIKALVKFCQDEYQDNTEEIKIINEFEDTYEPSKAVWWYTRECFIYKMINGALRTLDGDIIIRMGFFLCDLHRQIESLYKTQLSQDQEKELLVYRGQRLSIDDFNKFRKNKGGLISFNSFLSTTKKRPISLHYAKHALSKPGHVAVIFQMFINYTISSTPFADISTISLFKKEAEILFSMHTIFRIGEIREIDKDHPIYEVDLQLTRDDDCELQQLKERIREEVIGPTGWSRLGVLLIKIGQSEKAEQFYMALLEQKLSDSEKAHIYHQLGWLKDDQKQYEEAISFYKESLKIKRKTVPEDHPTMAPIYSNIGTICYRLGDNSKALEFYSKAHIILKQSSATSPLNLASSYNNIGLVYHKMGLDEKALECYQKDVNITKNNLPSYHPSLATSYNNIGTLYYSMGKYSEALSYLEEALTIRRKSLPASHPLIQETIENIERVKRKL